MKFTSIRLEGLQHIDLPITNAKVSDPYILKEAEGLGPPEVNIFITQTRHMDGYYKGREAQYREIVLTIGLNPNYKDNIMISDLRSELYGLISSGLSDSIDIVIVNNSTDLMRTTGYVKKMEVVPFRADPEVQITISCISSCFRDQKNMYVDIDSENGFQDITNKGTAETGIVFTVQANAAFSPGFMITDDRQNSMWINEKFEQNDILTIDTRPGSRSIMVTRFHPRTLSYEAPKSLLYALSRDSDWVWLYSGVNRLSFFSSVFSWTEFYYTPQYWGI